MPVIRNCDQYTCDACGKIEVTTAVTGAVRQPPAGWIILVLERGEKEQYACNKPCTHAVLDNITLEKANPYQI